MKPQITIVVRECADCGETYRYRRGVVYGAHPTRCFSCSIDVGTIDSHRIMRESANALRELLLIGPNPLR